MSSPPTTLGKYQIIREIARSNDIVYEAYDPLMNRRVALKELSMPNGSTPQQREERINRFKREARAAGTLAHPNIMTVYELGEEGDRFFIAMEFLDGQTLRSEVDSKASLSLERSIEIAIDVLRGLEFMHAKGVIHRDIKPDNIQILSDGRIKLTDFGIARLTFEPNLTMDGQVFGTPSYMSPEQVVGREIDARSDLFSLGIVLYEMIGGKKPFIGDSVVSITYAIMNKEPDRLADCNYAIWQVLERALDKSPALRYPSATEFIHALESALKASKAGPVLDVPPASLGMSGNPYMMPTPGVPTPPPALYNAPAPPPVLYPYNPYAQASTSVPVQPVPMSNAYMNSAYVPNPSGMPIYYAAPPRAPLFKPETVQFIKKFFLALLIVGTLAMAIFVVIGLINQEVAHGQLERKDREYAQSVNAQIKGLPIGDQIKHLEEANRQLSDGLVKDEEQAYAAQLYQERGARYYAARDYMGAEKDLIRATELDPSNSIYYKKLGEVYSQVAQNIADVRESAEIWSRCSETYIRAANVERNPERRTQLVDGAAIATYNYATRLYQTGQLHTARETLLDAQTFAPPHSEISSRIQQLLAKVPKNSLDTATEASINE